MVGKKAKKSWENNKNYLKIEKDCLVYNKQEFQYEQTEKKKSRGNNPKNKGKKREREREKKNLQVTDKILQIEKVGLRGGGARVEVSNTEK